MRFTSFTLLLAGATLLSADTLVLHNGSSIDGSFLGGDNRSIRFANGNQVKTYSLNDVDSLRFGNGSSTPAPSDSSANGNGAQAQFNGDQPNTSAPARYNNDQNANSGAQIPANTEIVVRMIDGVDSEHDSLGQTFRGSVDQPVVVNGQTVIPRGADVVATLVDAQKSGKIAGRTSLTLDLKSVQVNGRTYDIATSGVSQASGSRGARSAKVIGGTTALGALIGGLAGGGRGAAIGAGSGAAVGTTAQVVTNGQRVKIPSETRLTFALQNPLNL